jgi:hypothetical protein
MSADLSGTVSDAFEYSFFAREYTPNSLAINLTTGHTMLTFDSPSHTRFLEGKKPYSVDFVDGQIYMLSKFIEFFQDIYKQGSQPNPKYLLKSMEFLSAELEFERAEAEGHSK